MADLDITSLAAIAAALGVLIGLILTILELRQLVAQRKMEMMLKLVPNFRMSPNELNEATKLILTAEFKDYDDFVQRYGDFESSVSPVAEAFTTMAGWYEGLGILYYRRIVDRELISEFFGYAAVVDWEKTKPLVIGMREKTNPKVFEYFEYFAGEMKKKTEKPEPKVEAKAEVEIPTLFTGPPKRR